MGDVAEGEGILAWLEHGDGVVMIGRATEAAREAHPSFVKQEASFGKVMFDDWGGVINSGPVSHGPIRLVDHGVEPIHELF